MQREAANKKQEERAQDQDKHRMLPGCSQIKACPGLLASIISR